MNEKPLRIAFVAVAPFVSGSERCLQILVKMALKNGDAPILILEKGSPLISWGKSKNVPTYACYVNPLNAPTKLHWFFSQIVITFLMLTHRITVLHSNQIWSYSAIVLPAKLTKAKTVCHFRDPVDRGSKWWLRERPDIAIFISRYIEGQFHQVFGGQYAKRSTTLIDPIEIPDPIPFEDRAQKRRAQRRKLNIAADAFVYGFIGQIADVKGLAETIFYLSRIESKNWLLLIAGSDPIEGQPYLKKCQALISKYQIEENVRFLGFIDDASKFYHTLDVVLVLSKEEPLGLIPLEAAAHYTPAIVAKCGGLPETVIHNKTGWVVDLANEMSVIDAIQDSRKQSNDISDDTLRFHVTNISNPEKYWVNFRRLVEPD